MLTLGRGIFFCQVYRYDRDLYVGWDAHLNRGQWVEKTVGHGLDHQTRRPVKINTVVNGTQPVTEYDVTDLSCLIEWAHRSSSRPSSSTWRSGTSTRRSTSRSSAGDRQGLAAARVPAGGPAGRSEGQGGGEERGACSRSSGAPGDPRVNRPGDAWSGFRSGVAACAGHCLFVAQASRLCSSAEHRRDACATKGTPAAVAAETATPDRKPLQASGRSGQATPGPGGRPFVEVRHVPRPIRKRVRPLASGGGGPDRPAVARLASVRAVLVEPEKDRPLVPHGRLRPGAAGDGRRARPAADDARPGGRRGRAGPAEVPGVVRPAGAVRRRVRGLARLLANSTTGCWHGSRCCGAGRRRPASGRAACGSPATSGSAPSWTTCSSRPPPRATPWGIRSTCGRCRSWSAARRGGGMPRACSTPGVPAEVVHVQRTGRLADQRHGGVRGGPGRGERRGRRLAGGAPRRHFARAYRVLKFESWISVSSRAASRRTCAVGRIPATSSR